MYQSNFARVCLDEKKEFCFRQSIYTISSNSLSWLGFPRQAIKAKPSSFFFFEKNLHFFSHTHFSSFPITLPSCGPLQEKEIDMNGCN